MTTINTRVLGIGWITVAVCFLAGWLLIMAAVFEWIFKGMDLNKLFIQFAAHKIRERSKNKEIKMQG